MSDQFPKWLHHGSWISFLQSILSHRRSAAETGIPLCELVRLAELSPHLLLDLGFAEDRSARTPGYRIWRRGNLSVTITTAPPRVTAAVVGTANGPARRAPAKNEAIGLTAFARHV